MHPILRLLAVILLELSLVSLVCAAPAGLPRVFGASAQDAIVLPKADSYTVLRARAVQPDLSTVVDLATRTVDGEKPHFVVDLLPGIELEAEAIAGERRATGATVIARLIGVEMGTAILTVEVGTLTGTINYPGRNFLITVQPDGNYRLAEIDESKFPRELTPRAVQSEPDNASTVPWPSAFDVPADSGRLIDVMIVWTSEAQTAAGGLAAMQSLTQAAIDNANAAYLNSGIAQRLRRVYLPSGNVLYTEAHAGCGAGDNAYACALDTLTFGNIPNIATWRDTYGADLVSLFISDPFACGTAWVPLTDAALSDPAYGLSVVDQSCAVANISFAHMLAHNMGASHDPTDPSPGLFAYSHGYSSPNGNWRTVMASPGTCPALGPCTHVLYFSNPNVTYTDGVAMGTASVSNNALTLNKTAKVIAAYRPTSASAPPISAIYPPFADVPTSDPFYGYVEFMREAQFTSGCLTGYCRNDPVTRRQMAVFVERVKKAANYAPPTATGIFTDVPAGSQFAAFIEALYADGITSGCGATTYCPDDPVRRDQMAKFILKAKCGSAYVPATPASSPFTDVLVGDLSLPWINKLYLLGITSGCTATTFCPTAPVIRAAMAKFLEKAFAFGYPTEVCTP
jgi:Metallo-peptidase family M12/S-layer homology domain